LRAVRVRVGEVENTHLPWQVLPVHEAVDRSPRGERLLGQLNGGPAQLLVETSGYRQERVTQGFIVEPLAIHPPKQDVFGSLGPRGGVVFAALLVRAGEDDEAVQLLK